MKVKICGLTNKDDAIWALNYGADFLGVNFFKDSPRHNSVATAAKWMSQLPSFGSTVGVFVNADQDEIVEAVTKLNLKGIQLHGDETPEQVGMLKAAIAGTGRAVFVIKAFRIQDETSLAPMKDYVDVVDYFLLDSFVPDQLGGTGQRFNWALAQEAKALGKPVFLAGGLTPDNVKEAVKKVGPFAVDVSSGVEKSPRKKDQDKLKNFVTNAKG